MKTVLIALILLFSFSNHLHAQKKLTILCYTGGIKKNPIDYGVLNKILPDSLQKTILINPYKEYGFKNNNVIMQWLIFNGWKFITGITNTGGSNGSTSSDIHYVFSKEIPMDDSTYESCKEKLMSLK